MEFRSFRNDESGAVAVIFGITLAALTMIAGLAFVSSDINWTRSREHDALDAAVLAAASAPMGTTEEERILIAQNYYSESETIRPNTGADVVVESKPAPQFGTTDTTVYGNANIERKSPFLGLFGTDHLSIAVQSVATKYSGAPICVLGLDPAEDATMDFNGQASLELKNCASLANSSHGAGMRQVGQPSMKAADIGVTGGYTGTAYEPKPKTSVPPVLDPLASLPEPQAGACSPLSNARITNETVTLQTGTYCGGISLQAGSIVTLMPGIYIMKDGPLNVQAGAVVTGKEVMIAFIGQSSTLYMIGNTTMTLTSPTSGPYKNIQFFGDRNVYETPGGNGTNGNNLSFTVIGGSVLTYDGVLYAPSFHVWFAGSSAIQATSPNYLAIAKKLWFQDNTKVIFEQNNNRSLSVDESKYLEQVARLIK